MDVVWVFSGLQDQDELENSVKSVNNISHNRKIVIGDKPLFESFVKVKVFIHYLSVPRESLFFPELLESFLFLLLVSYC